MSPGAVYIYIYNSSALIACWYFIPWTRIKLIPTTTAANTWMIEIKCQKSFTGMKGGRWTVLLTDETATHFIWNRQCYYPLGLALASASRRLEDRLFKVLALISEALDLALVSEALDLALRLRSWNWPWPWYSQIQKLYLKTVFISDEHFILFCFTI